MPTLHRPVKGGLVAARLIEGTERRCRTLNTLSKAAAAQAQRFDNSHACISVPVLCSARIHDWVRQASTLEHQTDDSPDESPAHSPRFKNRQPHKPAHSDSESDHHAAVAVHLAGPEHARKDGYSFAAGRIASSDGPDSFVDSMADGMSDAGSGVDASMPAEQAGQEEELVVDMRLARQHPASDAACQSVSMPPSTLAMQIPFVTCTHQARPAGTCTDHSSSFSCCAAGEPSDSRNCPI